MVVVVVVAAASIRRPNPEDTALLGLQPHRLLLLSLLLLQVCLRVTGMLARWIMCLCTCMVCVLGWMCG